MFTQLHNHRWITQPGRSSFTSVIEDKVLGQFLPVWWSHGQCQEPSDMQSLPAHNGSQALLPQQSKNLNGFIHIINSKVRMDLFILLILFFLQTACEHFNGQFQCTWAKPLLKWDFQKVPISSALSLLMRRPVKMSSLASAWLISRGSRCVPPALQVGVC